MGVVDVIACAVGQDCVDQVSLDLGRHLSFPHKTSRIARRRLVLEIPLDAARK